MVPKIHIQRQTIDYFGKPLTFFLIESIPPQKKIDYFGKPLTLRLIETIPNKNHVLYFNSCPFPQNIHHKMTSQTVISRKSGSTFDSLCMEDVVGTSIF